MEPIRVGMTTQEADRATAEVFANVTDFAVILLDPELRIAAWNGGAENLFGHAPKAVIGQPTDLIFTPEDRQQRVPEHEAATARASGRAHDDRWHLRLDGSRFWASGILVALRTADGADAGFAKIMRDRTDLRMQIDTAKNRLAAVVEEQERKDHMLGTLAHELRNPLAPLTNAAKMIRLTAVHDSRLNYPVQIIERQISFLQRLIDDLVDIGRVGAGKLRLEVKRFPLHEALNDALDAARPHAAARRQSLQGVLPQVPVYIEADRERVVQIVVNLLNNAVRYTPPGGSIWLKTTVETGHAVVRVEDTGEGIALEMQPRIFDLVTQGRVAGGRGGGLGIGLALVKELVAAHGGTVTVRSEGVGRGSEFTVRLPLNPPPTVPD
jgi:two-component system CheB/CheR fusion protein